jgi:hypothetical protein
MIFRDFSAKRIFWIQSMEIIQNESKEARYLSISRNEEIQWKRKKPEGLKSF